MYGEIGLKLVQNGKRCQNLSHLPTYQTDLVRAATREVRDLDRATAATLEAFRSGSVGDGLDSSPGFDPATQPEAACALLVDHLAMRRNKRCLLAYHRVRADRLVGMCWAGIDAVERGQTDGARYGQGGEDTSGNADGNGDREAASKSSLSPEEEEYVRNYSDLLAAYKGRWTDVDLTGSLEPPRDLFIDVRVLKDAGEIQTEYGAITLSKNSQFFVRQGDVERLIAQGYLQRLG